MNRGCPITAELIFFLAINYWSDEIILPIFWLIEKEIASDIHETKQYFQENLFAHVYSFLFSSKYYFENTTDTTLKRHFEHCLKCFIGHQLENEGSYPVLISCVLIY